MARDDFPLKVKDILAKRVAFNCSNPDCRMTTVGPKTDDRSVINIGVAAHITAASNGGPRYDESLSEEQRKTFENGIWLCQSCGKLIDSDVTKYTVALLKEWKRKAEMQAAADLNKQLSSSDVPFREARDFETIKENGFYEKEFHGQKIRYYLQGPFLHVEHEPVEGLIAYYVLDPNGDVVQQKFPYDISEYSIEIAPELVLDRVMEKLPEEYTKETVYMKWGKVAIFVRDRHKKLVTMSIQKGWTINHVSKKIWIDPPGFKRS